MDDQEQPKQGEQDNNKPYADKPIVPENLQTTSDHGDEASNAKTIGAINAAHDGAIEQVWAAIRKLEHDMGEATAKLHAKLDAMGETVVAAPGDADAKESMSTLGRLTELERAAGIRR